MQRTVTTVVIGAGHAEPELRRLRQLEEENLKLTKLTADLLLETVMLQDVGSTKIAILRIDASGMANISH